VKIRVYEWRAGIAALRESWAQLVSAQNLNPSLHPDWLEITVSSHDLVRQALVLSVEVDGATLAIVPLLRRRIAIAGVSAALPGPLQQYCVVSRGIDRQRRPGAPDRCHYTRHLIARLDVMRLENLVSDGLTAVAVDDLARSSQNVLTYPGERSPYVTMGDVWTRYLASLPKKVRANITRCIRMTQQAGETGMAGLPTALTLSDFWPTSSRSNRAAARPRRESPFATSRWKARTTSACFPGSAATACSRTCCTSRIGRPHTYSARNGKAGSDNSRLLSLRIFGTPDFA